MKGELVKLKDCYVITNDSKIHENDWVLSGGIIARCIDFGGVLGFRLDSHFMIIQAVHKKITHTTISLENVKWVSVDVIIDAIKKHENIEYLLENDKTILEQKLFTIDDLITAITLARFHDSCCDEIFFDNTDEEIVNKLFISRYISNNTKWDVLVTENDEDYEIKII